MTKSTLRDRYEAVRARVEAAQRRAGRAGEVTVVAVTKTLPAEVIRTALDAGIRDIGENRVQELEEKVGELGRDAARWHLVGHLQRNKARRAITLFDLLHSLDSVRLARQLSDEATRAGTEVRALVQVNTSGEESKFGLVEGEAGEAIAEMAEMPGLVVAGVMTMAPFTADEQTLRRTFAGARRIAEAASRTFGGRTMELSMGMSNDFEVAVEEGSTMVRLGTVLFGERDT
jgi:PLP dependent protein